MAVHHPDIRLDSSEGPTQPASMAGGEPSVGELFGQLSSDAGRLVRQEVALAKAELRETGATLARDGTKIGIAVGLGLLGGMAATAFLIVALGDLLDNYWLSALIVTVLLLGVATFLAKRAVDDIRRRGVKPEQTLATLREDVDWAKQEAQVVKRGLTS